MKRRRVGGPWKHVPTRFSIRVEYKCFWIMPPRKNEWHSMHKGIHGMQMVFRDREEAHHCYLEITISAAAAEAIQCGFDFSPLSREELEIRSSRAVKDVENITLKQRLDQLSRRLRTARKWIEREREEGKLLSEPAISATGEFRSGTADSGHSNTSGFTSEGSGKHSRTQEQTQRASRRDSFDEAIEELPGMEDLGDTIGEMLSDEE